MVTLKAVLGLETSCDETAAALVDEGRTVRASVVSSQIDLHARYGGVVPEIASRAHLELIGPVVAETFESAGATLDDVDAVAACCGPGLAGALLVGVTAAKALALVTGVPYVGVNHLEAHLYGAWLQNPDLKLPVVMLLVSGGHTLLVAVDGRGEYRVLGETVDDAAGEAFDKVARLLGFGYPGGPEVDRHARIGSPTAVDFPRAMRGSLNFSFAGLKTAVALHLREHPEVLASEFGVDDIAASFQAAAVDQLREKLAAAADMVNATTLVLGGGVAANSALRSSVVELAETTGRDALLAPLELCTDNAAMIAAAGWWRLQSDGPTPLSAGVNPSARLPGSTP